MTELIAHHDEQSPPTSGSADPIVARIHSLDLRHGDAAIIRLDKTTRLDERAIMAYLAERNQSVEVVVVPDDAQDLKIPRDLIRRMIWGRAGSGRNL